MISENSAKSRANEANTTRPCQSVPPRQVVPVRPIPYPVTPISTQPSQLPQPPQAPQISQPPQPPKPRQTAQPKQTASAPTQRRASTAKSKASTGKAPTQKLVSKVGPMAANPSPQSIFPEQSSSTPPMAGGLFYGGASGAGYAASAGSFLPTGSFGLPRVNPTAVSGFVAPNAPTYVNPFETAASIYDDPQSHLLSQATSSSDRLPFSGAFSSFAPPNPAPRAHSQQLEQRSSQVMIPLTRLV